MWEGQNVPKYCTSATYLSTKTIHLLISSNIPIPGRAVTQEYSNIAPVTRYKLLTNINYKYSALDRGIYGNSEQLYTHVHPNTQR